MAFKKGDVVALKALVPTGPIMAFRMDEDGEIFCLVEWQDIEGDTQQRWFKADELQSAEP